MNRDSPRTILSADLDLCRDTALELMADEPYLAYTLFSLAARFRPWGKLLRRHRAKLWRILLWGGLAKSGQRFTLAMLSHPFAWFLQRVQSPPGELSTADEAVLCHVATKLEVTDILRAYRIYRMVARLCPDSEAVERERSLRPIFGGHLFTSRQDATTARLDAIILGAYLARKSGLSFHFGWQTSGGSIDNELCSIDHTFPDYLDAGFVDRYYLAESELRRYCCEDLAPGDCEFLPGDKLRDIAPSAGSTSPCYESPNYLAPVRLPESVFVQCRHDLATVAKEVLNERYLVGYEQRRRRLSDHVAIHYRGGDVVYGKNRHGSDSHSIPGKSAPLAIVEDVIVSLGDSRIVVFGTPIGDTLADLHYLRTRYANVELALDHAGDDMDDVVQDALTMAACSRLIGYGTTAVCYLARMVNPQLIFDSFDDMYPADEFFRLCYDNRHNSAYNPVQRSFHNVRALHLCAELGQSDRVQQELIANIRTLDPDNRLEGFRKLNEAAGTRFREE